ncbi:hypothetical protein LY474_11625 [Myxococcus stipitatus]|uniref:hypothetical protein n=1 Tax=Myxococcus stipitatus TaxID=83455 RepID=UPI001F245030|nr:hypothetical protein [Myxococcus stipitatus]MCE9668461.1 hypothetical protein [Myxococcus stipitatus]
MSELLRKPVTLGQFPARLAVGHVLRKVMERGELSRAELVNLAERLGRLAVLRPDGCMAWVRNGRTQQRVAPVEWKDGAFRAHDFELGRFYTGRSGVYRLLDDDLREVDGRLIAEVYDDADYVSRVLDGAESAFVKLALAIGHFFTYPLDSIASLKNLPAGVAALIESSPAYFERFQYMTRGEQIEAVAELATNLLLTTGTAGATTRTVTGALAGAEAMVPRVALSASGALTLERVAVPVGRAASVLGGGPGAAIVLQRAGDAASSAGSPGGVLPPAAGVKSYSSFKSFKRAMGPAGQGKEWHHIVEQTDGNVARFGPKAIHNTENIVALDKDLHTRVSAFYSSKNVSVTGSDALTVRQWLRAQSYEAQRAFGLRAVENVRKGLWR